MDLMKTSYIEQAKQDESILLKEWEQKQEKLCLAHSSLGGGQQMKRLLWWLATGTRGGETRAHIIKAVKEAPQNANQLSKLLELNYKTIRHHLKVLEKNRIVVSTGHHYAVTYFLSQELEENYVLFEEITYKKIHARTIKSA
jgi:DNA-binding transcriptional ArsR family regulator